ncbi:MAG: ABC transporter ATP-binding protein [Armatimonadetes bacterium]|nr:ABC transporter ATP-binding protein [Armatimonadota bacterium]
MPALELDQVDAGYGGRRILESISLAVGAGEVLAILGPNGAGKSTVLRAVHGLAQVTAGSVRFAGEDITGATPVANLRRGMAYLPQGGQVFAPLTVDEHLRLACARLGLAAGEREAAYARFPQLGEQRRQRAGSLSGGERQQVAIAAALLGRPQVLLADEPSIGLAPRVAREALEALDTARREVGAAVLLVEQNAALALEFATRVVLLLDGRVAGTASAGELAEDEALRRRFVYGLQPTDPSTMD